MAYGPGIKVNPRKGVSPKKGRLARENVLGARREYSHGDPVETERIPSMRLPTGGRYSTPACRSRKPKPGGKYLGPTTDAGLERQLRPAAQTKALKELWARLMVLRRRCQPDDLASTVHMDRTSQLLMARLHLLGVESETVEALIHEAAAVVPDIQPPALPAERLVFELAPRFLDELERVDQWGNPLSEEQRLQLARRKVRAALVVIYRRALAGELKARQWVNAHLSKRQWARIKRRLA